jgi:hypothetical protein
MVPMVESILNEFREEMPATRRVLERIPPDKLAWKPHAKSRSLGELAMHVANIPPWRKELQNLRVLSRQGPAAVCQQRGRDSRRPREKRSHRRGTPQHHDRAIRFGLFRCFCLLSSAVSPPSGLVAGHFGPFMSRLDFRS